MVHEIKMDKPLAPLTQGKVTQNFKQEANASEEQGVTVTNSMSKLLDLLSSDSYVPDENMKVMELKRKIDANEYKVDVDALAGKLLSSGVLGSVEE